MIAFIQTHGKERVAEIQKQATDEYTIGKEKQIEADKKRLTENYDAKLQNAEAKLKIEMSAKQNKLRIEKMQIINELVEKLQHDAKRSMVENLKKNPAQYEKLLKDLLMQGLIKLIEADITLRVRKSDLAMVKKIVDPAVAEYKKKMTTQVKACMGRDIPCRIKIDDKNFLPEFDESAEQSCMGGFVMYARRNRIVCS
mmetsp:Transcript_30901/g.22481  ORF Transcript_30901/g.22481 Transcript_30901/m.22481 type:complete len:198 (-) Transcript_30901:208-801(-)